MTQQEIPSWLGTIRQLDYKLPEPEPSLKNASASKTPYFIQNIYLGAVQTLQEPTNELIAREEQAKQAAVNKLSMRYRIANKAKELKIPIGQTRSAATKQPQPAAAYQIYSRFVRGY